MDTEEILLHLTITEKGDWNNIYDKIQRKVDVEPKVVEKTAKEFTGKYTTILNTTTYPNELRKHCMKPPFVLFYEGDINLLTNSNLTKIAIGSIRKADSDRKAVADKLIGQTDNICILKGENEINEYLIKNYPTNKYVVVLGKPLSTYSKTLKKIVLENGGLIITETPESAMDTLSSYQVVSAYRIVSTLADKVLIISVAKQSSINILIASALSSNKDIYVAPTSPTQEDYSNNEYIKEGAFVATRKEDLDL